MSISLGDPEPEVCRAMLKDPVQQLKKVWAEELLAQMVEDAVKVCNTGRSPSHNCVPVFWLLEKYLTRGAG